MKKTTRLSGRWSIGSGPDNRWARKSMQARTTPVKANAQSYQRKRKDVRVRRVETKMLTTIATENNELAKNAAGAGRPVITERIKRVVNGITGPRNLPGAKIQLPALLVKIGEQ